jgi:hypothetical protein
MDLEIANTKEEKGLKIHRNTVRWDDDKECSAGLTFSYNFYLYLDAAGFQLVREAIRDSR